MPSPRATVLTRRHRRELALLAGLVSTQSTQLAGALPTGEVDEWWEETAATRAHRVATTGYTVAATSGSRYLRTHAALEGRRVQPVRGQPNLEQIAASMRGAGPIAFKTHMRASGGDFSASRATMGAMLAGEAMRLTLAGDRDTVMNTFAASDQMVGWQRVISGQACAFCSMLASRGAVYVKTSVDFQTHRNCMCSPEPLYEREREPAWVSELRDQWDESTEGLSGSDALNAFRQARGMN